jgi:hypothetical protein
MNMISSNSPTTPAPTDNAEEKKNDETSPRTAVILRANLPPYIKALALRNSKKRFFVPSSMNSFGGISYPNVMIDNGCSSLLLPYPGMEALQAFSSNDFIWKIGSSGGTGPVNSVVLLIKHYENPSVGFINLAGSNVMPLPYLRIHLNTQTAQEVIDSNRVTNDNLTKLQEYVAMNYPPKTRHHVLLGQMVLDEMISVQHRSAFVLCSELPSAQDMARVHQVLNNLEKPEHFDELEDDDHDGDADFEENFDPWEEEELMDEEAD